MVERLEKELTDIITRTAEREGQLSFFKNKEKDLNDIVIRQQ